MKYISSNYTLNHDAYVGLDFFFFFRCTRTQTPKCRTADVWCQRGAWESRACGGLISISTIRSLFKRSRGRWRVKWAIHGFAGANHSTITRNAHTHTHMHTHIHTHNLKAGRLRQQLVTLCCSQHTTSSDTGVGSHSQLPIQTNMCTHTHIQMYKRWPVYTCNICTHCSSSKPCTLRHWSPLDKPTVDK